MSCVWRILEGDLESGVTGLRLDCDWTVEWSGGAVVGRSMMEWSDWTVEWSGVEYLVNSRLPVYHVNI